MGLPQNSKAQNGGSGFSSSYAEQSLSETANQGKIKKDRLKNLSFPLFPMNSPSSTTPQGQSKIRCRLIRFLRGRRPRRSTVSPTCSPSYIGPRWALAPTLPSFLTPRPVKSARRTGIHLCSPVVPICHRLGTYPVHTNIPSEALPTERGFSDTKLPLDVLLQRHGNK